MLIDDNLDDSSSEDQSASTNTKKVSIFASNNSKKAKFLSKKEREEFYVDEEQKIRQEQEEREKEITDKRKKLINVNKDKSSQNFSEKNQQDKILPKDKTINNTIEYKLLGEQKKDKDKEDKHVTSNTRTKVTIKVTEELESIKMQYLGLTKEKKKLLKPSEKFKNIFNFDWHASEDTSWDANPLYNTKYESMVLFGKGKMGGMDIDEQMDASDRYEKLVKKFQDKSDNDNGNVNGNNSTNHKNPTSKNLDEKNRDSHNKNLDKSKNRNTRDSREKDRERDRDKDRHNGDKDRHNKDKKKRKSKKHHRRGSSSRSRSRSRGSRDRHHSKRNRSRTRSRNNSSGSEKDKNDHNKKNDKQKELVPEIHSKYNRYSSLGSAYHWSKKRLREMTDRDWRIFREDHNIIIHGGRVNNPLRSWDENGFDPQLRKNIEEAGYIDPTPIQLQGIPIGIERKDLIALAPTGSGKSAAFIIPLIEKLIKLPRIDSELAALGPHSLIMAPTRELAIQIDQEFQKLAAGTGIISVVIVGGRNPEEQQFLLRNGCDILIGTPGRLKDVIESRFTVLTQTSFVVIDEADIMIDLGLEEALNYILDSIPSTNLKSKDENILESQIRQEIEGENNFRTTLMFSATMPPTLEQLARTYLRCPAYISIGEPAGGKKDINHIVECMDEGNKRGCLLKWFRKIDEGVRRKKECQILIFCNHKKEVESLYKLLDAERYSVSYYHGGKSQANRESTIEAFKAGKNFFIIKIRQLQNTCRNRFGWKGLGYKRYQVCNKL